MAFCASTPYLSPFLSSSSFHLVIYKHFLNFAALTLRVLSLTMVVYFENKGYAERGSHGET